MIGRTTVRVIDMGRPQPTGRAIFARRGSADTTRPFPVHTLRACLHPQGRTWLGARVALRLPTGPGTGGRRQRRHVRRLVAAHSRLGIGESFENARKGSIHYYCIPTPFVLQQATHLRDEPLSDEERDLHRPDLPIAVGQCANFEWPRNPPRPGGVRPRPRQRILPRVNAATVIDAQRSICRRSGRASAIARRPAEANGQLSPRSTHRRTWVRRPRKRVNCCVVVPVSRGRGAGWLPQICRRRPPQILNDDRHEGWIVAGAPLLAGQPSGQRRKRRSELAEARR